MITKYEELKLFLEKSFGGQDLTYAIQLLNLVVFETQLDVYAEYSKEKRRIVDEDGDYFYYEPTYDMFEDAELYEEADYYGI